MARVKDSISRGVCVRGLLLFLLCRMALEVNLVELMFSSEQFYKGNRMITKKPWVSPLWVILSCGGKNWREGPLEMRSGML